jgi:hypothetical protein
MCTAVTITIGLLLLSIHGSIHGSINGSIHGSINGSIHGSINGSINGSTNGSINGSISRDSSQLIEHRQQASDNSSPLLVQAALGALMVSG